MPSHFERVASWLPITIQGDTVVVVSYDGKHRFLQLCSDAFIVASVGEYVPGSARALDSRGGVVATYAMRPTPALLELPPEEVPTSILGYNYRTPSACAFDVSNEFHGVAIPALEAVAASSRHFVVLCQHAPDDDNDNEDNVDEVPIRDDDLDGVTDPVVRAVYAAGVAAYPSSTGMERMALNDMLTSIAMDKPTAAYLRRNASSNRHWLSALLQAPRDVQTSDWSAAIAALSERSENEVAQR